VVKSVTLGGVMAEVVITVGPLEFVSAITRTSVESLGLKVGDEVRTIVKSTEVLIDK
jgi:molybdopterin-binding protein